MTVVSVPIVAVDSRHQDHRKPNENAGGDENPFEDPPDYLPGCFNRVRHRLTFTRRCLIFTMAYTASPHPITRRPGFIQAAASFTLMFSVKSEMFTASPTNSYSRTNTQEATD